MASARTPEGQTTPVSAFYLVGVFLLLVGLALLGIHLGFSSSFGRAHFIVAMLLVVISGVFLVYPQFLRSRIAAAGAFDVSVKRAIDLVADVDAVRRAYFKLQQELEGMHRTVLEEARQAVESSLRARRMEEELFEARQQVAAANRDTAQWVSAVQEFATALERMLMHDDLAPEVVSTAERSFADFSRAVEPLGFRCIRPGKGEVFDDRIHRAGGQVETDEPMDGKVVSCSSWGFAQGGTILRKADVMLGASVPASTAVREQDTEGVRSASPAADGRALLVSADNASNEPGLATPDAGEPQRQQEGTPRD